MSTDDARRPAAPPFYASAEGERRALLELELLTREYPSFAMDLHEDGTPFVHGWLGPTDTLRARYHVLLVLPPGYGQGAQPLAYVLEPEIPREAPHLFADGSLCLDHDGAFRPASTLVTFLAWVAVWLVLYEGWRETGVRW
ncbi:hypothetical protein L6R52_27720 [Myxococcota bacterium]|nr:hypothetical protein [Myxococcota bacterium]